MCKRLTAMFLVASLGLFGAGCDDTMEGVEQDVEEGVDEIDEELDDTGDDG